MVALCLAPEVAPQAVPGERGPAIQQARLAPVVKLVRPVALRMVARVRPVAAAQREVCRRVEVVPCNLS